MDNMDASQILTAVGQVFGGIVVLGVIISRWTKTDSDDKFFGRLAQMLGLKSTPPAE